MVYYDFNCEMCKGSFQSDWDQETTLKEARKNGFTQPVEQMAIVCDDCYRVIMSNHIIQKSLNSAKKV